MRHLLGRIFLGLEHPKEAIACFDKAVAGYQSAGEQHDAARASCLVDLFKAKRAAGTHKEAWESLAQACNIRKALFVPEAAEIAEVLSMASTHCLEEMKDDNVRPLATSAIEIAQYMYGTGYLACLAIEGMIDVHAEAFESAARQAAKRLLPAGVEVDVTAWLGEWLLEQYSMLFGPCNQRLLDPLEDLAVLYEARGATESAVSALERKKAIKDRLPDLTLADRVEHLDNLARLYAKAGDHPKQIAVLKELLALHEEDTETDQTAWIAGIADRIGAAHLAADDFTAAFAWFKRAASFEPDEDVDNQDAILYRFHLGNAYEEHGRNGIRDSYRKALRAYRDALPLARRWLGRKDALVAYILGAMGNVLSALHSHGEAIRCHREALSIRKETDGAESVAVCNSLNDLGLALFCAGKYRESRRLLVRALPVCERVHGNRHVDMVPMLNSLGLACAGCEDYEHAIEHLARAVQILDDTFGASSIKLIEQLENLGDVCTLARRNGEAESAYRWALGISTAKQGTDAEETKELQSCVDRLAAGELPVEMDNLWTLQSDPQWRDEPDMAPVTASSLKANDGGEKDAPAKA
jgi:tetratricopeptide (TPR) repeat protein